MFLITNTYGKRNHIDLLPCDAISIKRVAVCIIGIPERNMQKKRWSTTKGSALTKALLRVGKRFEGTSCWTTPRKYMLREKAADPHSTHRQTSLVYTNPRFHILLVRLDHVSGQWDGSLQSYRST